ncbi:MAG: thiamine monophosphate synthase [Xanthobacteraceae bacterium]|jgi:thiamine-phosphate pyrophosphorylase|nr:thiamine monophosphate synthase [Xanthobacteraceae bacterium]
MVRTNSAPARPQPRLYLLTPPLDGADRDAILKAIRAAGKAADVAAILLRPGTAKAADLAPLVEAAHAIGAACLIETDVALADALGADGAHLDSADALKVALPALRPHGIAGTGGLRTKHEAMSAGELGADYVMFGEPDAAGRRPAFDATLERTDWWAQLFEPPCVAFAASLEEVEALSEAGADFIALDILAFDGDTLAAVAARLAGER